MNRFSAAGGFLRNWSWVPSLYFAEGLPAALVTMVSLVMFSTLKIPAEKTLFWTGLFSLPWMLRPLWVPVIDRFGTPRRWTVILEMVMGGLFVCAGFFASSISLFGLLCCCFFAAAVASATHDAAADGFYIVALDAPAQAGFSGIRSALYKFGTVTGQGIIAMAAGALLEVFSPGIAWGIVYVFAGIVMVLIGLWHLFAMPEVKNGTVSAVRSGGDAAFIWSPRSVLKFFSPYREAVKTPGFGKALAFLLLFRLAESQLRVAVPFLLADRSAGGMALTVSQQGFLYGTCGAAALIAGGILSGIAVAKHGMKSWLWPMVLAINVPDLVYVYLSFFRPESQWIIGSCVFVEQLGYGFGFTLQTLCMVCLARGKEGNETTRFALFTALSMLGVMVPGSFAGYLLKLPATLFPELDALACYRIFFIWVMVCTIPSFIVTGWMSKTLCAGFPAPERKSR